MRNVTSENAASGKRSEASCSNLRFKMSLLCVMMLALCIGVTPSKVYDEVHECISRCLSEYQMCSMCPGMSIVQCEETKRFCLEICVNMRGGEGDQKVS
ncbi:hypothetical protein LSAT2_022392 [Lamellibrachia satsuma]|nr:hypothetical protein LSAT2_022392 [Lamellibrachia satsuma]